MNNLENVELQEVIESETVNKKEIDKFVKKLNRLNPEKITNKVYDITNNVKDALYLCIQLNDKLSELSEHAKVDIEPYQIELHHSFDIFYNENSSDEDKNKAKIIIDDCTQKIHKITNKDRLYKLSPLALILGVVGIVAYKKKSTK